MEHRKMPNGGRDLRSRQNMRKNPNQRGKRRRKRRRDRRRKILEVWALLVILCVTGCWTFLLWRGKEEKAKYPGIRIGTETMSLLSRPIETAMLGEEEETSDADNNETGKENPEEETKAPPEGWELVLASEDWGLSFGDSGTQPAGNAAPSDLAWYDAYYVGDEEEKVIYLTFDCGYENGNTEPILDALKKHNAKGTFFVVGHFLETAPEMIKRMTEEGLAVGNHTYHHPDMSAISDLESFQKELDDVAKLFREITGTELSSYYRPPQGKCNVENLKMAQELGYDTIFWSLAHVDWDPDKQPSHGESIDKLTRRVHPGAIVLLHNTSRTNGEILDELLTRWEGMGYRFAPLSELVGR